MSKTILICRIVNINPTSETGFETPNYNYEVYDKNGEVIIKGTSSSPRWVKQDSVANYHSKKFDELYPNGWEVKFNF